MSLSQCYVRICSDVFWRSLCVGAPFALVWPLPTILCIAITIYHFIALPR